MTAIRNWHHRQGMPVRPAADKGWPVARMQSKVSRQRSWPLATVGTLTGVIERLRAGSHTSAAVVVYYPTAYSQCSRACEMTSQANMNQQRMMPANRALAHQFVDKAR